MQTKIILIYIQIKRKIHEYKLLYSTTQCRQSLSIKTLGDVNAVIYPPIK